ncbi:LysR family transcriptional regulator [Pseudofulvimonas gallinarii]|jgi:DNA-binding transcriptional LysR family regulator|uniref:Transcriptional regulator /LysR family transcriptional regulator n=1 Tax=Pseudofulvimonas gallinarii TaxID=634155 RepID=A0A4R3LHH9_9GAMM|nr:LysR family transcriptional regulator [Pseudofulvimonas gallinarii]TCS99599.1 transcriptional regulator /LysR family transcriptional regulator [Pseudofulvimonas gallinarii]THD14828.1 LysR family transcriptional regulator [Pseudofulvimonas gallinarii]
MPAQPARYYYKGNRLKQLRAFCALVKFGTLSRAADALYLGQSAVSLQLSALEEEMAVPLLERQGRNLRVTREGMALYELARPLIEGIDGIDESLRQTLSGMDTGELNIAAGESTILHLLPTLVRRNRERHPGVHVHLHNVTGRDGLALIRNDQVDLAIGSMLEVPPDIAYEPVYHFDPMLIAPLDHPLAQIAEPTLEDISPHGLILPPRRLSTWRLVDLVFQQRRVPYKLALEVGGWEVIKQYVAMGLGISIVTGFCLTASDRERLLVRNLRAYFPQRSYGVVVRKGRVLTPHARRFVDLVKPGLFTRGHSDPGHSER